MSADGVPTHWVPAEIGGICHLINGRAFKPSEWSTDGLPIVRIQNLNNPNATFNHFNGEVENRYILNKGDLLFAWSGTPGTSFGAHVWRGSRSVLNQHIFRVSFDQENIIKSFLRYAINQKLDELILGAHGGVGLRHVTKGKFEKTKISFPSLAEQKQIAAKLDELLAQVDSLKTRLDAIPAILKRFRQSVLAAAVSGRLTEQWRQKNQSSSNWQPHRIEDISKREKYSLAIGPFGSNLKVVDYQDSGHPLIFVREIRSQNFNSNSTKFINLKKYEELKAHRVKPGDILITKMGDPPGDVAIYPMDRPEGVITSDCIKLSTNELIAQTKFVFFSMKSESFRNQVLAIAAGVAQQKVNLKKFKGLILDIPTIEEQTEIVRRVDQLFAHADQIEQRLKDAQARVDHLTQSILAKAFRGELTADWREQNPDLISGENSAQALLARIQAERAKHPPAKRRRKPATSP